ncbi:MAG TPA: hypothetical protein VID27_19680, partial [Blastocatellia bacterium]
MHKLVSGIVAFFLLALHWSANSCGKSASNNNKIAQADNAVSQSDIESEEYTVYSALIEELFISQETKLVVITNRTIAEDDDIGKSLQERINESIPEVSKETLSSYESRKKEAHLLSSRFNLRVEYKLVSRGEIDKLLKEEGRWWDAFYKKYPKSPGLISFSNVGFNPEMTEAFLYVSRWCGSLCGTG